MQTHTHTHHTPCKFCSCRETKSDSASYISLMRLGEEYLVPKSDPPAALGEIVHHFRARRRTSFSSNNALSPPFRLLPAALPCISLWPIIMSEKNHTRNMFCGMEVRGDNGPPPCTISLVELHTAHAVELLSSFASLVMSHVWRRNRVTSSYLRPPPSQPPL